MCALCAENEKEAERKRLVAYATRLRELASKYDAMANGRIKPHTDEAKNIGFAARMVVRELVEQWV